MLRKITKAISRFEPGNVHDYARGVWEKIARDLMSERVAREVMTQRSTRERLAAELREKLNRQPTDDEIEARFATIVDQVRAELKSGQRKGPSDKEVQAFLNSFSAAVEMNQMLEVSGTRGERLRKSLDARHPVTRRGNA